MPEVILLKETCIIGFASLSRSSALIPRPFFFEFYFDSIYRLVLKDYRPNCGRYYCKYK
jgi:hypothetical protein